MPRRSAGPRLVLERAERDAAGRLVRHATWTIRDAGRKVRTGCREGEVDAAQQQLAAYIAAKFEPARTRNRDPDRISVAEVILVYIDDVTHRHARPKEAVARLNRVSEAMGHLSLSRLTAATCRAYVEERGSGAARRELEDLRAAVGHYHAEGYVSTAVKITLPERGQARERWLTRKEAARLLWSAWRLRQRYRGEETVRETAKHVARFILVALYTGTRAGAVCGAAIRPTVGRGYVDIDAGVFHRRPPGQRETKKRQPPVPIPPRLLAHLRRWERLGLSAASVVEWQGRPVGRINKAFRAVREAAKLGPDVVPHTLRHTAATWLLQTGCDPWIAAKFLGMSLDTLERVYGHHHPDHLGQARDAIGRSPGPYRDRNARTEVEHSRSVAGASPRKTA